MPQRHAPAPITIRCRFAVADLVPHMRQFPSLHIVAASLLVACTTLAAAADEPAAAPTDDGPYVFRVGDRLDAWWVCAGKPERRTVPHAASVPTVLAPLCGFPHAVTVLPPAPPAAASIPATARIVAVSDIHGQYDLLVRLLRANGVIDAADHWALGKDTLVVAGDVFDRGPRVTEAFWLLYGLQREAAAAGGSVQFVLGNHETMVLYDDLRYVNPKYAQVAQVLGKRYPALYGADSAIGQWLRSRPALLRVGDTLFLHGGIAPQSIDLALHAEDTNAGYRASLGMPRAEVKQDPRYARLYDGKASPIWYRGYFNGELDDAGVDAVVKQLGVARIVVGHTTIGEVASFHHGKVIAIDSGIKRGQSGQLLFIENGKLSRGLPDGTRQPLPELTAVPEDKD